eukprot:1860342-Pyramimonas_sp.AAC.1
MQESERDRLEELLCKQANQKSAKRARVVRSDFNASFNRMLQQFQPRVGAVPGGGRGPAVVGEPGAGDAGERAQPSSPEYAKGEGAEGRVRPSRPLSRHCLQPAPNAVEFLF